MKLALSNGNNIARAVLLCAFGCSLLSVSSPSKADSKTLTISGTPSPTIAVGGKYSFQPAARDTVKSRLKFNVYNKPAWASFDETTGRIWGQPTRGDVGTYRNITIRLTDWYGYVTTPTFSITVVNAPAVPPVATNTPPTISGRALTTVDVGAAYSFSPQASDVNHDKLSFGIKNKPTWAKFDTASGTLSGTPATTDAGAYANIQISVSDGKAGMALPAFTIVVNRSLANNAVLDWTPPTENTDGSVLTNLAGYIVRYGKSANNLTDIVKLQNPGLTNYVVDELTTGTWYFSVSSYTASGVESTQSGVISTTIL
jgi:hypothetical protein